MVYIDGVLLKNLDGALTGKVVELGGGDQPLYHPNLDMRPMQNVDIVCDLNRHLPLADGECDAIYSRYVLEHLSWRSVQGFLSEIHRVLRSGGRALIITANTLEQARYAAGLANWDERVSSLLFGDQNYGATSWDANAHHSAFSPVYIRKLLKDVGFWEIEVQPIVTEVGPTDMIVTARKSKAEIER